MNSVTNYPGIPAVFVRAEGDWSCSDSAGDICRRMVFGSTVEGSLIIRFSLFGYKDGRVSININWGKYNDLFIKYLQEHQVLVSDMDCRLCSHWTQSPEELKAVFSILTQNNQIPAKYLKQIEPIVEKGSCEAYQPRAGNDERISFEGWSYIPFGI